MIADQIRRYAVERLRSAADDLNMSCGDDERAAGMADAFAEIIRFIDRAVQS